MYDVNRTMTPVMKKLDEQVDKGISSGNIDWLCKLSEIGKNMKKIEYYDSVIEEMQRGHSYDDGYSERRHRDSMGRYARTGGNSYNDESSYRGRNSYRGGMSYDNGYSEAKCDLMDARQSYRASKSPESKRDVMDAAERIKEKFMAEVKELIANADTREERDIYKAMLHGIGNLA